METAGDYEIFLVPSPEPKFEASEEKADAAPILTKREFLAAIALQGILAGSYHHAVDAPHEAAQIAVAFADALIDALHR